MYNSSVSLLSGVNVVQDWQVGVPTALIHVGCCFTLILLPCEI
jgi:hypothetical protein